MLSWLKKIKAKSKTKANNSHNNTDTALDIYITKSIENNITCLKSFMNNSHDIKDRRFKIRESKTGVGIVFIDNLVDINIVHEHIIKPLMVNSTRLSSVETSNLSIEDVKDYILYGGIVEEVNTLNEISSGILNGKTFLCIEGSVRGLLINTKNIPKRNIDEPQTEPSIKGPKEGFVESLKDNIGLIRKRLMSSDLCLEFFKTGNITNNQTAIVYIKGKANNQIVQEVKRRINSVKSYNIVGLEQLQGLISDRSFTIFPLIQWTERPDKTVAALLEGKVGILYDNSRGILLAPTTITTLMQSPDDYYEMWFIGSVITLFRYLSVFISTLLPAIYIALTSFHPGMLPTALALSITGTRAGVPLPAFFEALLMVVILEILQEAGTRLPRVVGQTVSIVGGFVIGQAAVQAGIISPIMVIIISITAVSSFSLPSYSLGLATRILRIAFMASAAFLGAFGISMGILYLLGYMCSLKSFGVGFMEPITPYRFKDWKDSIIRAPQVFLTNNPEYLNSQSNSKKGGSKHE